MGETGVTKVWLFAAMLAAVSLAADPLPAPPPPPVNPTPGAVPIPAQPAPLPTAPAAEQCDAASLTYLIGKPRTEIPTPIDPSRRRVYCSSCVITEDYRPERTDIVYDERTGLVTDVKCG